MLDIVEDRDKHLVFRHPESGRVRVLMRAVVDNAVHVEVEAVELGDAVLCDELRDRRISLRHPSEELRDTHDRDRSKGEDRRDKTRDVVVKVARQAGKVVARVSQNIKS